MLGAERAHTVFADPPYDVKIQRHVSGLGRVRHRAMEIDPVYADTSVKRWQE